ncbi:CHAT domain-containing protein [Flavilitoribacter nigricans]|uniref:CHAT domain-containing protein n=1 Tax=Flavilitoribacter nigricans (strain ATCC 23147 / DSM 23189 / NBRC 102662 / NCIMB 1420 / SS-2) TaxID=1122177 RepID=A0A2D0MX76_FLAN2|nr:CHAT domain-containing protein [Flavilitoribacter nigricans]PHN00845.1 hypothetical protein CRP01_40125 [Flavilitoribacter nigricans DSM 23189 = NBRC 102662]
MPNNPPVFFFAAANRSDSPLKALARESDLIRRALMEHRHNFYIQIEHEPFITLDRLAYYLTEFSHSIQLFHFSGHAAEDHLILEGTTAKGMQVAETLARLESLQLVFLNGCETEKTARRLLELGVPAVIGTHRPVPDEKAASMARSFYHAMAKGYELDDAFQNAATIVDAGETEEFRGQGMDGAEETPHYFIAYRDEKAKHWVIPTVSYREIIVPGASEIHNFQQSPVNQVLIQVLWEVLKDYSDELEFFHLQHQKGKHVDFRRIRRAITDTLPAPVGEQVRKLFAAEHRIETANIRRFTYERLDQIIRTYNSLVELVAYIMLAQLWDAKMSNRELIVPRYQSSVIRQFFTLSPHELMSYDYIRLIRAIRIIFDENDIPYFIEEIARAKKALYEDEAFIHAYRFMQYMREKQPHVERKLEAGEIESYCVQAEKHLGDIFRQLGFCAKYSFHTVKQINLIRPRHRLPMFRHITVKLDTITAGFLDEENLYQHFLDDNSVILVKEPLNSSKPEFLNLSPFVIDEHALKQKELSRIFYFHYYNFDYQTIYYKLAQMETEKLIIDTGNYPELIQELNDFCYLFFDVDLKHMP